MGEEKEGLMDEMEEEADSYEPSQVCSRMLTSPTLLMYAHHSYDALSGILAYPNLSLPMLTHAHVCSWTRRKRRVTLTSRKRRVAVTSPNSSTH